MKHLLLAAVAAIALTGPALADREVSLGINPTSGTGAFANTDPGTAGAGAFVDTYLFDLTGAPQFITIASVTNTFASSDQFISGFTGAVLNTNGTLTRADDTFVIGPVPAVACPGSPTDCQGFAGSALLDPGTYYLQITGDAGVNAGYGGNLSTTGIAVPGPTAGTGAIPILMGMGLAWYRRRRQA